MEASSLVAVLAPIASALVAGALAFFAARTTKTHEWRLAIAKEELAYRRGVYSRFLQSCQQTATNTIHTKKLQYEQLEASMHVYAELQLFASEPVRQAAKALIGVAIHHPKADDEPVPFYKVASAFSEAARFELNVLKEASP